MGRGDDQIFLSIDLVLENPWYPPAGLGFSSYFFFHNEIDSSHTHKSFNPQISTFQGSDNLPFSNVGNVSSLVSNRTVFLCLVPRPPELKGTQIFRFTNACLTCCSNPEVDLVTDSHELMLRIIIMQNFNFQTGCLC